MGHWLDLFRVWSGNLMRPVALPAVGGLLSAVLLFSMIAPMYMGFANSHPNDVPTMLSTQATLKLSRISYGAIDQDVVVDVLVNDRGRMVDYSVPGGQVWQYDATIRRCVENILLCTEFTPATMFGLPTAGRIRISVRSNQVNVQG